MSKPWIFISPSSRGIGHALTRHLLQTTSLPILATARSDPGGVKASILTGLRLPQPPRPPLSSSTLHEKGTIEATASRLHVVQLDVTDEHTIAAAASRAESLFPRDAHHLHLGVALPGILWPERSPAQVDYDAALETLRVNVLGPLMLMKHFGRFLPRKSTNVGFESENSDCNYTYDAALLPIDTTSGGEKGEEERRVPAGSRNRSRRKLPQHATFLTASARVGSVSDNRLGGWYSYRASKAGVNSLVRTFDLHLRTQNKGRAIAVAYHPGTVRTGLSRDFWGGVAPGKLFSAEFAAERLVEVVLSRTPEHGGRCWDWKGEEVLP
ncbi:hypothetical protein MGN70_012987 [Eutypa lata]|nr:hypothetical protein MGN70_012987 [Eutypa lata]